MNIVKPTTRQLETIKRMKGAKSLQEAMMAAGYSGKTATHPKQNFIDRVGTQEALKEYRDLLYKAGATPEVLAEIEAAGLFEENGAIRLGYLKEVKKSYALTQDTPTIAVQVNNYDQAKSEAAKFVTEVDSGE